MPVIKYNKLVRDRIPEIIEKSGKRCTTAILSDEAYLALLDEKLNEELAEYQESKSMEELADLLEVIRAVALARGSSIEEIEAIRRDKAEKRGGFARRILLIEVADGDE
ncbi:MAG: phosphoribosyl-ATP pyrophosphohydrolase [Christensenellales bacterium]